MVAPGNQGDVVALLEQAGPDGAPDGTGPHDDEAHGVHSATCQALAVASLNPVERAAALGGTVAGAPLRLVGGLAAPARGDMARTVRRAIGITEEPPPIATDPDDAYLPPGRHGPAGPRRPARHADRRRQRAPAPDRCTRSPWRAWRSTPATARTRWAGCAGRRPSSARRPSARWPRPRPPSPRCTGSTAGSRASPPTGGRTRPTTPSW